MLNIHNRLRSSFQMTDVIQSNDGFKRPSMPLSIIGTIFL